VAGLVRLLSEEFVKLVLLANLIAWPIAWFAMNTWLKNFAYRIEISWWVFALAGGLAFVIALLTVSTQAIRAAVANPVESLRYE
jgi:putative ABC transport system permease protein